VPPRRAPDLVRVPPRPVPARPALVRPDPVRAPRLAAAGERARPDPPAARFRPPVPPFGRAVPLGARVAMLHTV